MYTWSVDACCCRVDPPISRRAARGSAGSRAAPGSWARAHAPWSGPLSDLLCILVEKKQRVF